jgi:hypothetical protein
MKKKKKSPFMQHLDNIRKQKKSGDPIEKSIEFSCRNCLNLFIFEYSDICLNNKGDIEFIPEPACPCCSSKDDIIFSNYGQEKIEDMLFNNQIKNCQ